jgi:hypothetical protein
LRFHGESCTQPDECQDGKAPPVHAELTPTSTGCRHCMGAVLQDLQDVKGCIISTVLHWHYVDVRDELKTPPPECVIFHA